MFGLTQNFSEPKYDARLLRKQLLRKPEGLLVLNQKKILYLAQTGNAIVLS